MDHAGGNADVPGEPAVTVVAAKANRIVCAAQGRSIFEFGFRRAKSCDTAILGARAAFIGGCDGTSCTIVDRKY